MCALTNKVEECCTLQRSRGFVERADLVLLSIGSKHFVQIRSYDKAGHLRNGQTSHNLLCLQIKNQNVAVSGNVCRIIKMKTMVVECLVIGYRACVCDKEQMGIGVNRLKIKAIKKLGGGRIQRIWSPLGFQAFR